MTCQSETKERNFELSTLNKSELFCFSVVNSWSIVNKLRYSNSNAQNANQNAVFHFLISCNCEKQFQWIFPDKFKQKTLLSKCKWLSRIRLENPASLRHIFISFINNHNIEGLKHYRDSRLDLIFQKMKII